MELSILYVDHTSRPNSVGIVILIITQIIGNFNVFSKNELAGLNLHVCDICN